MAVFILLVVVGFIALVFLAGRYRDPRFGPVHIVPPANILPMATGKLSITTWNIGFAALGKDADFILDKGKHLRALSHVQIYDAAHQISQHLQGVGTDVILLQETARAGFLTRGVPVNALVQMALPTMSHTYWTDFAAPFAPSPLKMDHGLAIFAARSSNTASALKLSPEPMTHYGFLKKYYAGLVQRFPICNSTLEWVVINLHLSAFDTSPEAKKAQVAALFDFATAEHAKGNPVIIGGDWNMRMCDTEFPHAPRLNSRDWSYEFPIELVPDGWRRAVDPATPTVRSMQEPYSKGENHTMIIDGFIVSPGIAIEQVATTDLGFGPTDHHPVSAVYSYQSDGNFPSK